MARTAKELKKLSKQGYFIDKDQDEYDDYGYQDEGVNLDDFLEKTNNAPIIDSAANTSSASSDVSNPDTFAKFAEALDKAQTIKNNPFTAFGEIGQGIAKGISLLDPNGDKALLTTEQKINYANNNIANLSDENKNKLNEYNDILDNLDASRMSLTDNFNPEENERFAANSQRLKELKASLQQDLNLDDETFNKYVSSSKFLKNLEDRQRQQEEYANASAGEKALANIGDALLAPIRPYTTLKGYLDEKGNPYYDENLGVDHNATGFDLANISRDVTTQATKDIEELTGANEEDANLGNKAANEVLKTLYTGVKSGADSMARLATGEVSTLLGAGLEAADQQYVDAGERGLTKAQAIGTAISSGAAETVFEKIPVDNMLKLWKNGAEGVAKGGVKAAVKEILQQAGLEGMEEVETDIANKFSDAIINKDKSEFNTQVEEYKAQGMDEAEAFGRTLLDNVADTVESFAGGAIGGLVGGGGAIAGSVATTKEAKKLDGNYREVAQAIPDNVEDYNSEEDYNKAMEVKARAEELDTQDKVSSADRSGLLQDIYAVNETMPNVDLIENINESVNSPFADVGGFQVAKNDITSQQVAQSMSQASQDNNINDFVEAYRDSQASSDAEARQTGQQYFDTLSPKFYTYDEGSRLLDNALSENTADELYTMALNGEEVAPELLNTQKKADYYNQGAERRNNLIELQNQLQEQRKAQELKEKEAIGQTTIEKVETPQGKADIADISINNDGSFVWKKGDDEVVIPKKDISDKAMQQYMEYATSQPTLRAKQLYADNYTGSMPIGNYNMAFTQAFNAGRGNSYRTFKQFNDAKPYFSEQIPVETLEAFYNEGKRLHDEESKKSTVNKDRRGKTVERKGTGKVTYDKSIDKNDPIVKKAELTAELTGLDVEIVDGDIYEERNGEKVRVKGQFLPNLSKIIISKNTRVNETLDHEGIGEYMEAYNPEDMKEIQDLLLNYLFETNASELQEEIDKMHDLYRKVNPNTSMRDAANEVINNALSGVFSSEEGIQKLADYAYKNNKQSAFEKLVQFIKDLVNKIKSLVDNEGLNKQAERVAKMEQQRLEELQDKILNALTKARQNYENTAVEGATEDMAASLDARYSLDVDSIETNNNNIFQFDNENLNKEEQTGVFKKVEASRGLPYIWIIAPKYVSNDTWKALAEIEGTDWKNLKDRAVRSNIYYINNSYTQDFLEYLTGTEVEDNTNLADEKAEEAEETFGTTSSWEDTGYLTTNGLQIDLSVKDSGVSYREDHNSISEIMDSNGVDAVYDFLKLGNIRIIPEVSGIELIEEPNSEQYDKLYDYFAYNNGEARVDLSNDKGGGEGTILYREGTSPQRILSDIENYFETGEVPEGTDDGNVYYSLDTEGNELTEEQQDFFKDSKVRDNQGRLKVMYHGTETPGFTVFNSSNRKGFTDKYNAIFVTDNKKVAETYTRDNKGVYPLYVNATNPYIVDAEGRTFHNWHVNNYAKKYTDIQLEVSSEGHKFAYWHEDGERKRSYGDFTIEELVDKFGEKIGIFDFADDTHIGVIYLDENGNNIPTSTDDCVLHAKNNGYDSVIFNNIRDMGRFAEDYETSQVVAVFDANQIKNVDNENPTDSADIRFSLDVDSEGEKLSEGQKKFFDNSKATDIEYEVYEGETRLANLYHGTVREFYTFDKDYASVEGNVGAGFYFTNDISDVERNYANEDGTDLTNKIEREADILEGWGDYEDLSHEEIVEKLRKKYITSEEPIVLEVYLNIQNPVYITTYEGKESLAYSDLGRQDTLLFTYEDLDPGYDVEDFESKEEYQEEVDAFIEGELQDIIYQVDNSEEIADVVYDAFYKGGITFEDLKKELNNLYLEDEEGNFNANEVARQLVEALGYDGIIDYTPYYKFRNMGVQSTTTHYIVFNSNQAKATSNENPTDNEDIRYSLDVPTTYALDDYDPFIDDDVTETKDSKEAFTNSIIKAANDVLNFNISDKQVSDIADKMIADYSSTVDKDFVTKNLRNIFSAMNSDNIQDMTNALINLSEEVVRKSEEIDPDEQANYDDFIKNMPKIKLSEEQKNEAINRMGDWNTVFGAMGRFLSNDTSTTLDGNVYWQICDNALEHNYVMDRDANDADQLMNIIEAVENMRPQSRAIFEGGDITDAALVTANEIMQQYYGYALKDAQANANLKEVRADLRKQVDDYKRVIGKQYQEQVNRLNKQLKDKDSEIKQLRAFNTSEISKAISIEKARIATAEKKAKADKTSLNKYIERQERNKHLKSIRNQAIRTIKMLENPTRNKFIPEVLQKPTIEMLQTFDFVTYRVRKNGELVPWGEEKGGEPTKTNKMWREKMEALHSKLVELELLTGDKKKDLSKYGANSSYLYNLGAQLGDVTEGLLDQFLQDTKNDTVKISTLSSDKLKVLDKFMKSYLASINNAQEAMIDGNKVQLAEVGQKIINEISELKPLTSVSSQGTLDFLNLDMIEPYTIMSELGGTMEKLYWHLFSGKNVRDQHIFDTEKVFSDKKKELKLDDKTTSSWQSGLMSFKDGKLQLTPAQVMSLYAAYGRNQARHHIIFGGVMSADEALTKRKDKKKKAVQTKPVHLTPKDVEEIVNTLTPQQKALADFMVDYMSNEVSDWGNRVSQKRWGIRLFTENHYFPIKTYDVTRKSIKAEEGNGNSLFALQNQGFTKPLQQDANNALVLDDIFSVFADHVAKMAAYDGYVIPINDFMRVFNYAESQETFVVKQGEEGQHREDSSVKEQIERIFGKGRSTQYFRTFIKNINEDYGDNLPLNRIERMFSKNKAQAVLANFRVIAQQPTAYPRAMEVIEGKYLTKALASNPVKNAKKSKNNNTLAMFKSKGYYETSIGQSMQQMITGNFTVKDKVNEVTGALAGIADDLTWGTIYHAAELKVKAETKLKEGTKEFKDEVNKLANKAFAATQVVDSVFTKSQIMRSQNTGAKIITAFMAEPTKYYNMLHRGVFKTIQTGKKQFALKATYLFVVGQVLNAIVVSAVDAFRNDDDDKTWFSKYLNALLGIDDIAEAKGIGATVEAILKANLVENLNPANLIPGVKEIVSALEGFDNKNMSTQAIYDIVKDAKKLVKDAEGDGNLTWYGKAQTLAEMVSLATGMPFSSGLREVKTIHNNLNNLWGGDNWVKTEETTNPAVKSISTGENIREATKEQYETKVQYFLDEGNNRKDSESKAKNSVKSSIRNKYKDQLAELKDKDINKANELKRNIIEAYMTLGDSQADANKTINGWMK